MTETVTPDNADMNTHNGDHEELDPFNLPDNLVFDSWIARQKERVLGTASNPNKAAVAKLHELFDSVGMADKYQPFDPLPALSLFSYEFYMVVILMDYRGASVLGGITAYSDVAMVDDPCGDHKTYDVMDTCLRELGKPVPPRMEYDDNFCPTPRFIVALALFLMRGPPPPEGHTGLRTWQILKIVLREPSCFTELFCSRGHPLETNLVRFFCELPPVEYDEWGREKKTP